MRTRWRLPLWKDTVVGIEGDNCRMTTEKKKNWSRESQETQGLLGRVLLCSLSQDLRISALRRQL